MPKKYEDLSGKRFGRLLVIERDYEGHISNKEVVWKCICDCGNIKYVRSSGLKNKTRSCGCLSLERIGNMNRTHSLSKTRLYVVWKQMRKRCNNPNCREYRWYGAKGVKVCDEWEKDFVSFRNWMLSHGYDETAKRGKHTIDRINPFGNYEPDNCRIVSMDVQLHNLRRNHTDDNT